MIGTPRVGVVVLIAGVGVIGGYFAGKTAALHSADWLLVPIEEQGTSYTYVHPLLGYRVPEATLFGDYVALKDSLQTVVGTQTRLGNVSRASVYFRDLDAGRWVGIQQDDTYYPASLLKVPVMIAYFKQAEERYTTLQETIAYDPAVLADLSFETPSALVPGHSYSVQEYIHHMIVDSDNGAAFTLLANFNQDLLDATYRALGIPDPGEHSADYQISARTFGLFFRILYNTTYLSVEYSERALKLLSQTSFVDGIVAGVPKGTAVAHKFGEHVITQHSVIKGVELSDCGIVYYPKHPYLMCVMTTGPDVSRTATAIAQLSATAYKAVDERYAPPTKTGY